MLRPKRVKLSLYCHVSVCVCICMKTAENNGLFLCAVEPNARPFRFSKRLCKINFDMSVK